MLVVVFFVGCVGGLYVGGVVVVVLHRVVVMMACVRVCVFVFVSVCVL